jgi:hypothetical protein
MMQFIRRPFCAALFGALALAAPLLAGAQTYNATKSFTPQTQTNPNDVWSYGYLASTTREFVLYPTYQSDASSIEWVDASHNILNTPIFAKNISDTAWNGVSPGQITLHPGPGAGVTAFDDASVLRFIAPVAGRYSVKLRLFAGDAGETEAWVVKDGRRDAPLVHFVTTTTEPAGTKIVKLSQGSTLDVIVGHAADGFLFDNTPLTLLITKVAAAQE